MLSSAGITELLIDWSKGNEDALEKLFPLVESELRRLAHNYINGLKPGNMLQTTAVINETYILLVDQNVAQWQNRAHFFGIAATIMRRVILNYIRDRNCEKRGGQWLRITLTENIAATEQEPEEIIALEAALCRLEQIHARKAKVVELRYYGGLSVEETAEVLKVSSQTVLRDWNLAKAWLAREISHGS